MILPTDAIFWNVIDVGSATFLNVQVTKTPLPCRSTVTMLPLIVVRPGLSQMMLVA